jgi:hypothetical protein
LQSGSRQQNTVLPEPTAAGWWRLLQLYANRYTRGYSGPRGDPTDPKIFSVSDRPYAPHPTPPLPPGRRPDRFLMTWPGRPRSLFPVPPLLRLHTGSPPLGHAHHHHPLDPSSLLRLRVSAARARRPAPRGVGGGSASAPRAWWLGTWRGGVEIELEGPVAARVSLLPTGSFYSSAPTADDGFRSLLRAAESGAAGRGGGALIRCRLGCRPAVSPRLRDGGIRVSHACSCRFGAEIWLFFPSPRAVWNENRNLAFWSAFPSSSCFYTWC